jgi:hypothetical protein
MPNRLLTALVALACATPAHAYIDPNVGGWLYQLLFPLLIAIAGAWAVLREKISAAVSRLVERFRSK